MTVPDQADEVETASPNAPGPDTEDDSVPPVPTFDEIMQSLAPQNQELLNAILEVSQKPDCDRGRLYMALVGALYLVPVAHEPSVSQKDGQGGEISLEVLILTGPNQEPVIPVFTHMDAVKRWNPQDQLTTVMAGQDLFNLCAASPVQLIALNPAGPFGGNVARAEFEPLSQGMLPGQAGLSAGAQGSSGPIYIDLPLEPLQEATSSRLHCILEGNASVRSAYLFLMQAGAEAGPQLTLGLRTEGAAGQWVEPLIRRTLLKEGLSFEPYSVPVILMIDAVPGAESIPERVPAFFSRDGADSVLSAPRTEPKSAGWDIPVAGEEVDVDENLMSDEDDIASATGSDFNDLSQESTESPSADSEPEQEASPASSRKRSRWPFGKNRA